MVGYSLFRTLSIYPRMKKEKGTILPALLFSSNKIHNLSEFEELLSELVSDFPNDLARLEFEFILKAALCKDSVFYFGCGIGWEKSSRNGLIAIGSRISLPEYILKRSNLQNEPIDTFYTNSKIFIEFDKEKFFGSERKITYLV